MGALAITVGAGKDRPQGRRVAMADNLSPASALRAALQDLPAEAGAWWSPHSFRPGTTRDKEGVPTERPADYRHGDLWESSIAIAIDADNDGHAAWEDAASKAVLSAIVNLEIPGSMAHFTPHGLRVLFPLVEPVTDAVAWKRAAAGACAQVRNALSRIDGVRMEIDIAASCDTARFYWAPRAIVDSVARDAQVNFLSDRAWTLEELTADAPVVATEPKRAEPVADEILPNDRHETLMRLAASLRNKGLKAGEIYAALREVNERRCKPPKPDSEIRALADYFGKKDAAKDPPRSGDDIKIADAISPRVLAIFGAYPKIRALFHGYGKLVFSEDGGQQDTTSAGYDFSLVLALAKKGIADESELATTLWFRLDGAARAEGPGYVSLTVREALAFLASSPSRSRGSSGAPIDFTTVAVRVFASDPPLCELTIEGVAIMLTSKQLLSVTEVRERVFNGLHKVVQLPKTAEWHEIVNHMMERADIVNQPPEASPAGLLREEILRLVEDLGTGEAAADLDRDRAVLHEGKKAFKAKTLLKRLREQFPDLKTQELCAELGRLEFTSTTIRVIGVSVRAWVQGTRGQGGEMRASETP